MSKENLINRITLLDTGCYRRDCEGNIYRHEPPKFRSTLFEVYNNLSEEKLKTLLNTRLNNIVMNKEDDQLPYSDCCGYETTETEMGICPDCLEHCEFLTDES